MQIFVPFKEPFEVAKCLDPRRLNKQIIECQQILDAIDGIGKGWFNHPIVKMYKDYRDWLNLYKESLEEFKRYLYDDYCYHLDKALYKSNLADKIIPPFLTEEFCNQHKRRLYTKDKEYYKQFADYGESEENWYFVNGEIVKYINGKKQN